MTIDYLKILAIYSFIATDLLTVAALVEGNATNEQLQMAIRLLERIAGRLEMIGAIDD